MDDTEAGVSAIDVLRRSIEHLHRENAKPSTREIARRAGHAVSHVTVGDILRGERVPRWQSLEPVVKALHGDVLEFRRLWLEADDERNEAREGVEQRRPTSGDRQPSASWDRRTPQGSLGVSSGDYFCYVSHSKVERLYATMAASTGHTDPAHPAVTALFRDGGTFGLPHLLHGGSLDRTELMRRLRQVLTGLARRGAVAELDGADPPTVAQYLHHAGVFRALRHDGPGLTDPAVDVVRLESQSRPGLLLDCSLRYFSEAVDGRYAVSSVTSAFLSGGGDLAFDTVFVLLNRTQEAMVGSPLYLKLYGGGIEVAL